MPPLIRPAKHGGRPRKRGSTLDPSGYDVGKKVVGRKRHLLTDTIGMLLAVIEHAANVRQHAETVEVAAAHEPRLPRAGAGGGGNRLRPLTARISADALDKGKQFSRLSQQRFGVPPVLYRWIVERTIGCISRNRRLAHDFARHWRIGAAFVRIVMNRTMLRRLAPKLSA